ncbi:MAG: DnaB-like helicase C-terminal domain-containing protein [Actinomycetes bacterium]
MAANGRARPRSLADLVADADAAARRGSAYGGQRWPTGFTPLDDHLGGGLRAGELTLVSGAQGQGKTTFVLQAARNAAAVGLPVLYVSYEHPEDDVLARLLGMEAGLVAGPGAFRLGELRGVLDAAGPTPGGLSERLAALGDGSEVVDVLADRGGFTVLGASGNPLALDALAKLVLDIDPRPMVAVDYLQKVATSTPSRDEAEQVTRVVEGLKDLALRAGVPVLAVVAAESSGIATGRVRLHHLRGSSALAYEADVALMLNNKYRAVAQHHLAFSTTNVEKFQEYVVVSIEKIRGGKDGIDLEFRTAFDRGHFDPLGGEVLEHLVDDRVGGG